MENLVKKRIYLASNNLDDDSDFNQKAFENKDDVIAFCHKQNEKGEDWGWHEIVFYSRK